MSSASFNRLFSFSRPGTRNKPGVVRSNTKVNHVTYYMFDISRVRLSSSVTRVLTTRGIFGFFGSFFKSSLNGQPNTNVAKIRTMVIAKYGKKVLPFVLLIFTLLSCLLINSCQSLRSFSVPKISRYETAKKIALFSNLAGVQLRARLTHVIFSFAIFFFLFRFIFILFVVFVSERV